MNKRKNELIKKFNKLFDKNPEIIVHAPGRVNLIGEHTDYSEGFVMPIAINLGMDVAISKNNNDETKLYSIDYDELYTINLEKLLPKKNSWLNYCTGVIDQMVKEGYSIENFNLAFSGNVPQGAGLSSSAALEIGTGYALQNLFELQIGDVELALIGQKAEHNMVGVKCGIMDQYISRLGKKNYALLIDTRTLKYEQIPIDLEDNSILITNSNVPHKLSSSKYNERVEECKKAVNFMDPTRKKKYLRDFTLGDWNNFKEQMPEVIQKRALHVISENERVIKSKEYLKNNDFKNFGKLMNASHESLKNNYEVSCKELDWLVENANLIDGVFGSRMTGAGFGGCTVTLIKNQSIKEYLTILTEYEQIFGYKGEIIETNASDGAKIIWNNQN